MLTVSNDEDVVDLDAPELPETAQVANIVLMDWRILDQMVYCLQRTFIGSPTSAIHACEAMSEYLDKFISDIDFMHRVLTDAKMHRREPRTGGDALEWERGG